MNNVCTFSECRKYRYSLEHSWQDLLIENRRIMWIGLNPSTADERTLDRTLWRILGFSMAWGFTSFVMTNLFAFRATEPKDMLAAADPVGPENNAALETEAMRCDVIVACWGADGKYRARDLDVASRLIDFHGRELQCLGFNADGTPKHPLYQPADLKLQPFKKREVRS